MVDADGHVILRLIPPCCGIPPIASRVPAFQKRKNLIISDTWTKQKKLPGWNKLK
jgi:hypothetical protein